MSACPECGKTDRVDVVAIAIDRRHSPGIAESVEGGMCRRCGIWFLPWGEFGDLEGDDFDEAE